MRCLITGMGGDIGTGVALRLDLDPTIELMGIDMEPPRRRMVHKPEFHRVPPEDVETRVELIRGYDPEVLIHLGIYEPHSRSNPADATRRTRAVTESVFRAAPDCPSLEKVVMRSGIEVYGRDRGTALRPDEGAPRLPTTRFGRSLLEAENAAMSFARSSGIPVTILRFAPIVGPYIPSPLGRFLRLPVIPFAAPIDGPIQLTHIDDVHDALVVAAISDVSGVFNVVGDGAVTGSQAARIGGRLPVPVFGPGWLLARAITAALGSPLPEHALEAMRRGQTADGSLVGRELGFKPARSTRDCVTDLYQWASVVRLEPRREVAA
jgi:UDP-glucose 4-epimerase